jgi:hypothetical protein
MNDETNRNNENVISNTGNRIGTGFKCSHGVSIALNKKIGNKNEANTAEHINDSGRERITESTKPKPRK